MDALKKLARPEILKLEREHFIRDKNKKIIWMSANENNCSVVAKHGFHQYPDRQPQELLAKLSKLYHVSESQLLIARGSNELIELLPRTFCRPEKDAVIICPPTYEMYEISAVLQSAHVLEVPLIKGEDFALDTKQLLKKWNAKVKVIFLASPNNPTGCLLDQESILQVCEKVKNRSLVVVDEAYIEFAGCNSMLKYLDQYPNLVILRTLSKAYGMAGVRCGVLIAHPTIIELTKQVLAVHPLSTPVINVLNKHLNKKHLVASWKQVEVVKKDRMKLTKFLEKLRFVKNVWPSTTNFLLVTVDDADRFVDYCDQHYFKIRDVSERLGLENCVRISIGNPRENIKFMKMVGKYPLM